MPQFDQSDALKEQLVSFANFWSEDADKTNSSATVDKRVSRVLLFLGFLAAVIHAIDDPKMLTLAACLNFVAVNAFIDWLTKARDGRLSNAVEYLSTFIAVGKFLCKDCEASLRANNYGAFEPILRMRRLRNQLQSRERLDNRRTAQDLEDEGRWLDFDEFRQCVRQLQLEFEDVALDDDRTPSPESARVLHDLMLCRLQESCPARSGEVRTLEFLDYEDVLQAKGKKSVAEYVSSQRMNVISKRKGQWQMWHSNFKTYKSRGVDVTVLKIEDFPELADALDKYLLEAYRTKLLARGHRHNFLFMDSEGNPFNDTAFPR